MHPHLVLELCVYIGREKERDEISLFKLYARTNVNVCLFICV